MSEQKRKISLKKIGIALLSLAMVVGFIFLFIAASEDRSEGNCNGIAISFHQTRAINYVDTAEMRTHLLGEHDWNPVGKPLSQLNISLLKRVVDSLDWVKGSEIYIGNHGILNLQIKQRIPVARVFTHGGKSFYLDESGNKSDIAGKFTIKLPVFTNFPDKEKSTKKDSLLLLQIRKLSQFITRNKFWKAQVEQIKINRNNNFDIIPQVGDAVIVFGDGNDIEEKFSKLMTFYKGGLNNVGWGYYDTIDLRFSDQVVGIRKNKKGNPVIKMLSEHNAPQKFQDLREKMAVDEKRNKEE